MWKNEITCNKSEQLKQMQERCNEEWDTIKKIGEQLGKAKVIDQDLTQKYTIEIRNKKREEIER